MRVLQGIILLFVFILLGACGKTPEEKLDGAQASIAAGEYSSAVIELKDILQGNSENVKARFLLGSIYYNVGDYSGAAKEYGIAIQQGWDQDGVFYKYLSSLKELGKYGEISESLNTPKLSQGLSDIDVKEMKAWISFGAGNFTEAEAQFREVLKDHNDRYNAKIGLAKIFIERGDKLSAERILAEVLEGGAVAPEAVLIYADLLFQLNKGREAEVYLVRAMKSEPGQMLTMRGLLLRLALTRVLLADKRYEESHALISKTYKQAPEHALVAYYKGFDEYRLKNYAEAKEILTKIINSSPSHSPSLLLLGTINYLEENYEQAAFFLERYLGGVAQNSEARKMLGITHMKLNQSELAMEVLRPVLDSGDQQALRLAGIASLESGDNDSGVEFFRSAVKLNPDAVDVRVELAKAYLTTGSLDNATLELEKTLSSGHVSQQAFSLLVNLYLRRGSIDKALDVAKKEAERIPGDPFYHNIIGQLYSIKKNYLSALDSFNAALKIDSNYWVSEIYKAKVYMAMNDKDKAESTFSHLIMNYTNPNVAAEYVRFLLLNKNENKAMEYISLLPIEKEYFRLSMLLLQMYDKAGKKDEALVYLAKLDKHADGKLVVNDFKGKVGLREGDGAAAISSYKKVVEENPEAFGAYYQLAKGYLLNKETEKAKDALLKVVSINENYLPALSLLSNLYLSNNEVKKAEQLIVAYIKRRSTHFSGYELKGDFYSRQNDYKKAISQYKKALSFQTERYQVALKIAKNYVAEKDFQSAIAFLNEKQFSSDESIFIVGLERSMINLESGKPDRAKSDLLALAKRFSNDGAKLNDIAWKLHNIDKEAAYDYASKALALLPNLAAVNDTYGWIALKNGKIAESLSTLEKAHKLAPGNAEIEYHYAVALHENGDVKQAKSIFLKLRDAGADFDGKADIMAYLK